MSEKYTPPEIQKIAQQETETPEGRRLEGNERQAEEDEWREAATALEAALQDPDLDDETRAELQEQLELMNDSLEASEAGGDWLKYDES